MNELDQEKIKTGVLSAISGVVLTLIIGFTWGGWVLGNTSQNMGEEMARNAVTERLMPICIIQFNQDIEKHKKLKELKELSSWKRPQYVKDQGWATIPFEKEPDSLVADKCSELIVGSS